MTIAEEILTAYEGVEKAEDLLVDYFNTKVGPGDWYNFFILKDLNAIDLYLPKQADYRQILDYVWDAGFRMCYITQEHFIDIFFNPKMPPKDFSSDTETEKTNE